MFSLKDFKAMFNSRVDLVIQMGNGQNKGLTFYLLMTLPFFNVLTVLAICHHICVMILPMSELTEDYHLKLNKFWVFSHPEFVRFIKIFLF